MKKVILKWRDRDITVKYQCINFGGVHYAKVLDKYGKETHLVRQLDEGRWMWRGGFNTKWPEDLIELLSDFFNQQTPDKIEPVRTHG